jgi:tetratricopeptide (TPR) repeat protein
MNNVIAWYRAINIRFFLAVVFLLVAQMSHAETVLLNDGHSSTIDRQSAREIVARIARYEFLLGNYFQSLSEVSLAAADKAESSGQQLKLMQAKLYQYFDMERDAYQSYLAYQPTEKNAELTTSERGDMWMTLAQQAYRHGDNTIVSNALTQYKMLHELEKPEAYYYLLGQVSLKNNQLNLAHQALEKIATKSPLRRYLLLNLALKSVADGNIAVAEAQLQQVTLLSASDELNDEVNTLINKAYLSLGYLYLQQASYEQAQAAFRAVSLTAPETESALLGYGWAALKLKKYQSALAIFQQLTQATKMTPYVQEAYVAIPYILEQMQENTKAYHAYLTSVARFDEHLLILSRAIEATEFEDYFSNWLVAKPVLAASFPAKQAIKGRGFTLALPDEINTYTLVASLRFQTGLKELKDAAAIIKQLHFWQDEFSNSISTSLTSNVTATTVDEYLQRIDSQLTKAESLQQELRSELTLQIKQSLQLQLENVQHYRQTALIAIAKINDQAFELQHPIVEEFSMDNRPTAGDINE